MNAVISPGVAYRYRWERNIGGFQAGPSVAWIMVTPSTANAETDDATIRTRVGVSERLGFGHIVVGTLFAVRATDIRAFRAAADPVG